MQSSIGQKRSGLIGLLLCVCVSPAQALGGDATVLAGNRLENRTVMVLSSQGGACSGTVITPSIILTAAHCVSRAGQYAVATRDSAGKVALQEVRQIARHPEFQAGARASIDMALVRLASPLPARFSPVTLDDGAQENGVGSVQTIAGFGLAREGDEASAGILRSASVSVLPRYFPRFLRLGPVQGTIAICQGDSGGPVFSEATSDVTVIGVIYGKENSDGRQCGATAQAVRVAPQRRWINGIMAQWAK